MTGNRAADAVEAEPRPVLQLNWNPKQLQFLQCEDPFQNLEGGVRAGKSYVLCWKAFQYACRYPGICIALTRYTQDGLDAILKPVWREVCRMAHVKPRWISDEQCEELPNGSRVYLRALKGSDDQQRYSKLAGLTLSILAIDQAEELPEDIYRHYVPARLSQPGYPKQVWITPNPPMPNSWIAKDWPESGARKGYRLIQTSMFDNADILGADYISLNLAAYDEGTLEYRRLVEGKRGLIVAGTPIYQRHFDPKRHFDAALAVDLSLPLVECIDFGTRHPCCVWLQFPPGGRLHILGGLMGADLSLDEFIPEIKDTRRRWFGEVPTLQWTCDPAGSAANSHGSKSGVQILQDWGIFPRVEGNANYPPQRAFAIQTVVGYLRRADGHGNPVFSIHPQFEIVSPRGRQTDALLEQVFAGGYCYDNKRTYAGTNYPHLTPPLKDGWFEHPANALEYGILAYAPRDPAEDAGFMNSPASERRARQILQTLNRPQTALEVQRLQRDLMAARAERDRARQDRAALRIAQRDDDGFKWQPRATLGRGGY